MNYEPQNYEELLGLPGFSDELLKNHFSLYEGYVKNTNKLIEQTESLLKEDRAETPEFNETRRRFGWEFNGMRLHEYYFENLVKNSRSLDKESDLYLKIVEDFGSFEAWEKDFRSTGMIRGIGWVVLYYDIEADKLFNVWINEHNENHLTGAIPILVMDVWEHAYMIQYGLKRADYIDAFIKAIDWEVVSDRFGVETELDEE